MTDQKAAAPLASGKHAPVLSLQQVGKSFGPIPVLRDISLDVMPTETLGLIGPNGAGKTTLFNLISGLYSPGSGQILFRGKSLAASTPAARARMGLVRTFQKSMIFPALSIQDNIAMAVRASNGTGYCWRRPSDNSALDKARAIIDTSSMRGRHADPVSDLSYGEQRIVDILIALAQEPALLLLDEPTAGLSDAEAKSLLALVREQHAHIAILLISHDIDIVFQACDRVAVLDLGKLLVVDSPQAVAGHPDARAAYLGQLSGVSA
jgi:branched-chain amino acid transport system ATP-binding protein